ncbi:unnamed protein product [Larinioides sclopetarius]|uniref:Uncharacterized protein n=1 Tax=Larinioides sclopetarius TaxID=280406 RepID=A0AAV1Z815_9ARAC
MQSGREQFLPFFSCRAWERVVVALCFDKETNVKKIKKSCSKWIMEPTTFQIVIRILRK